jgi:hypothetical protein
LLALLVMYSKVNTQSNVDKVSPCFMSFRTWTILSIMDENSDYWYFCRSRVSYACSTRPREGTSDGQWTWQTEEIPPIERFVKLISHSFLPVYLYHSFFMMALTISDIFFLLSGMIRLFVYLTMFCHENSSGWLWTVGMDFVIRLECYSTNCQNSLKKIMNNISEGVHFNNRIRIRDPLNAK